MAQNSAENSYLIGTDRAGIGAEQMRSLLENMDGVMYQTAMEEDGTIRVVYTSESLYTAMRRDPKEVGMNGANVLDLVLPEDLEPLLEAIRTACRNDTALNYAFRVFYKDGKIEWRHVHGVRLPLQEGPLRMIHLVTNIDMRRQAEEALQEKERIVEFAMRNTDINIWYFDYDKKECLQGENCQRAHEMTGNPLLRNFPDCLFEMGYVREDSIEPLRQAYRNLWETGESVEFDAWFRKADGSGWWCERDMLTAIKGLDGRVARGVGIGKNVTAEKELEEQFQTFQNYRHLVEKNTVASFRMNLTTGWFGDCVTDSEAVRVAYSELNTVDDFLEMSRKRIVPPEDLPRCNAFFSQSHLLDAFTRGETHLSLEYRYLNSNNRVMWLRSAVEMMKNPATGDVEALLYTGDIDYEKNMSFLMDRLLDVDYEFLGLIDVATGRLQVFGKNVEVEGMARNGGIYEAEMARVFQGLILTEYCEEGIRTMALSHVIKELESTSYYSCSFPTRNYANSCAGRKQWKFGYLDDTKSLIFIARTDITDIYTAEYDALTGLYNRQAFYRHAREMLNAHPSEKFVLVRCDIDRFKAFNDVCGAHAGDRLLAQFGKVVRRYSWSGASVFGRIEADHFCVLYPKSELNIDLWNKIHTDWLNGNAQGYHLTSSMGVYEVNDHRIDVSLMCDRALLALRTVKDCYIGKVAWYDERLREKMMAEQALADEMEQALKEKQFVLYFQPQVCYADGSLVGAEALVRWNHPERGLIPPGEFIPLFEKNGFILKLDAYVWEECCAYLRRRLDGGGSLSEIPISVNISRRDLYDPALCEKLRMLVEKHRLPASLLRLEITESAYMDDPGQLIGVVNELRRLGFTVEMDDFGTGYSSLTMLKDVPVDVLKLDMKFLSQVESDRRGGLILSAVIRLAHSLELPVIAEGVETVAQADYLKDLGCSDMQGYYFGRPMPEAEFEERFVRVCL